MDIMSGNASAAFDGRLGRGSKAKRVTRLASGLMRSEDASQLVKPA
jgi:hypothetical protein